MVQSRQVQSQQTQQNQGKTFYEEFSGKTQQERDILRILVSSYHDIKGANATRFASFKGAIAKLDYERLLQLMTHMNSRLTGQEVSALTVENKYRQLISECTACGTSNALIVMQQAEEAVAHLESLSPSLSPAVLPEGEPNESS